MWDTLKRTHLPERVHRVRGGVRSVSAPNPLGWVDKKRVSVKTRAGLSRKRLSKVGIEVSGGKILLGRRPHSAHATHVSSLWSDLRSRRSTRRRVVGKRALI